MRRIIISLLLLITALCARAQWTVTAYGDYTYSRTEGHGGALAVIGECQMNKSFRIVMGVEGSFGSPYSANILWQNDLYSTDQWTWYLENRYLYRLFPSYSLQEFTAMLDLGWRNDHFNVQLGLFNRYVAEIPLRKDGGQGTLFEPMNLAFSVEGNVFDDSHPWNIGARISNWEPFVIERVTLFYYCLTGYYELKDGLRLTGEVCLHPSGTLNLSAQPNGCCLHIGMEWNLNNNIK